MEPEQQNGYEAGEPRSAFIAIFGAATIVVLILVILGLQAYFDRVSQQQIFVKVLQPVSEDLLNLRAREDAQLHSYQYLDRAAGRVRIPIERAMELLVAESKAGGSPDAK